MNPFNQKIVGKINIDWDRLKKKFALNLGERATFFITLKQLQKLEFESFVSEKAYIRKLQEDKEWNEREKELSEEAEELLDVSQIGG